MDSTMGTESSVMEFSSMGKTLLLEGLAMVLKVSPMAVISTTAIKWMGLMLYMVTLGTTLTKLIFSRREILVVV